LFTRKLVVTKKFILSRQVNRSIVIRENEYVVLSHLCVLTLPRCPNFVDCTPPISFLGEKHILFQSFKIKTRLEAETLYCMAVIYCYLFFV